MFLALKMYYPEIDSAFHVKIMLCYILDRINKPVTEEQLYEIVVNSDIINYFYYAGAITELIETGSITKSEKDGQTYIELNKKGKYGSEYFKEYIPEHFHKRLLRSAYSLFSKIKRENETDISIKEISNGYEVNCTIKDVSFDLMKISLYAPDEEQANAIKEKILLSPAKFYQNVIDFALNNTEDSIKSDILEKKNKSL